MVFLIKSICTILIIIASTGFVLSPVFAHSFNVSLVLPESNSSPSVGAQLLNGFLLATKERDSHPEEESDGHLGGLDVYVTLINWQGDESTRIGQFALQKGTDIVVIFEQSVTEDFATQLLDKNNIAVLLPGQSPFPKSKLSAVKSFVSAYNKEYGTEPSHWSAQGYNAARRIEVAIRLQGSVDDKSALLREFDETKNDFEW